MGKLNGDKVLDIGCRDKVFKKYLEGDFKYTGIDFDPSKSINTNENDQIINYNLETGLPEHADFDIINALDVLEHVENIHELLNDIFSKSKKKAKLAFKNLERFNLKLQ